MNWNNFKFEEIVVNGSQQETNLSLTKSDQEFQTKQKKKTVTYSDSYPGRHFLLPSISLNQVHLDSDQ